MSVEVWNLAINAEIKSPTTKAVLLGLANHASPDGKHVYPSVKRLSIYTSLSESTVRMKLAELRNDEIIKVVKKAYRYRPTEYEIDIKKLKAMKHPDLHLLEPSSSTATSRGASAGGLEAQTSRRPTSGLQETDIRPPSAGGEPSLTIKEPLKPSRAKSTRTSNNRIRKALQEQFIHCTHLKPPLADTQKQRNAAGSAWWAPLREIAELTGWDVLHGQSLISRTVQQMREDGLTISSPRSILNVARSIVAEGAESVSGTREFLDDLRGG